MKMSSEKMDEEREKVREGCRAETKLLNEQVNQSTESSVTTTTTLFTKTIYINWKKFENPQAVFELFEADSKKKGIEARS